MLDTANIEPDSDTILTLGYDFCLESNILPSVSGRGNLRLFCANPFDAQAMLEANFIMRTEAQICLAPSQSIRNELRRWKTSYADPTELQQLDGGHIHKVEKDGSRAARYLDRLISDAIDANASDIHISPEITSFVVRFRVNGRLMRHEDFDTDAGKEVISRIKYLGGASVTENRLPQDGSFQRRVGGRPIEVRVSTMPSPLGESVVCRLLDPETHHRGWTELGFADDVAQKVISSVQRPSGLFVIAGPTGSGKTTTIYTALQHLNDGSRKIITVEDPIEQTISGIDQIQINEPTGLDFGTVLRSTLRHDPDVIMIGEIRDAATAEIACRAALLGRLVIATVHAKSIQAAQERFVNLGIDRYLVQEVLVGVLAQTLQPISCGDCHGDGCSLCKNTGVIGRKMQADISTRI